MKLTPAQWLIFQENQKKAPVPAPAQPAGEQPSAADISVEQDRSTSFSYNYIEN